MKSQVTDNQAKEAAAQRRVVRNMIVSGLTLVLAIAAGFFMLARPEEAVLIVTSQPEGGEVVLNYRPTGAKTSALLADLPADSFVVSLRMDGHRPVPAEQGVRLLPNDTTRITFLMSAIKLEDERTLPRADGKPYSWEWRHVRLTSEPTGALIMLEDYDTGLKTPAEMLLPKGVHHLQAHWPNGAKSFKNVSIDPNESAPDVIFLPMTYVRPKQQEQSE